MAVAGPPQGYEGDGQPVWLLCLFLQTPPAALVQVPHCSAVHVILHVDPPVSTSSPRVGLLPNPDIGHQLSALGNQSCQDFLVGIYGGEIRLRDFSVELGTWILNSTRE